MTRPNHLSLGELIKLLEVEDPQKVVKIGFGGPHAYRGYYDELAFEIRDHVSVAEMLRDARLAVGATYQGWKGGDYTMKEWTSCWLVAAEGDCGESLGALLLERLLADVVTPVEVAGTA